MKAIEVIDTFDLERPNQIKSDIKMRWLKSIEATIVSDVIQKHHLPEDLEDTDFDTYFDEWGTDFEMLVPEQFIEVYTHYLDQKASYMEDEQDRYNMATTLFNNAYISYQQWYNRNNIPTTQVIRVFDHTKENY